MYSQNDEEAHILEALGDRTGVLLDIGAFDGKTRSNSLALIERGWSGVLVEPSPKPFLDLLALHGKNPALKLVNCLIGIENRMMPLWISEDGLTTTEKANYELWKEKASFNPQSYMPQVTILALIHAFPRLEGVDFVTIDTEGTSMELFKSWPFDRVRPEVFCVETDGRAQELEEFAATEGYHSTYSSNENLVLVTP